MLTWDEAAHSLDLPQMDDTHREFMALLAAAEAASDDDFVARLDELIAHTRRHFENESALMRQCRFPATAEHEADHQRVLGDLDRLRRGCDQGRLALARDYVDYGLPEWFASHLVTMDSCLAGCVARGGH